MDEQMNSLLEEEYCPPLDPALFSAIISDFNLEDPASIISARGILESIKISALDEESSAFDPSGNSTQIPQVDNSLVSDGDSGSESCEPRSTSTDLTSLSNGVQGLGLDEATHTHGESALTEEHFSGYEKLDNATKTQLLKEMFPNASDFAVSYTFRKCNENYYKALEELLNHTFFNEQSLQNENDRVATKGIEAFLEDVAPHTRRGRKKRDRTRRQTEDILDSPRSSSLPSTPMSSSWDKSRRDIDFIASRTNLSRSMISSIYHLNGASISATIIALIESSHPTPGSGPSIATNDPTIQANAFELGRDFPTVSPVHLTGLIHLTHPSTAAAHELAKALTALPNSTSHNTLLDLTPRYAPLNISSDSEDPPTRTPYRRIIAHSENDLAPRITYHDGSYASHQASASLHHSAAQRAFSSASAASRRGRSDHLMAAAAGYYSEVGRAEAAARAEATAGAADALVESQSSRGVVDLHGVAVRDAVRIARSRTEAWWRVGKGGRVMGLDGRMRNADENGGSGQVPELRIVTGIGRHSEGGRGKLGPAVGKMLLGDGWHVVFGEGVLIVVGKKRKV